MNTVITPAALERSAFIRMRLHDFLRCPIFHNALARHFGPAHLYVFPTQDKFVEYVFPTQDKFVEFNGDLLEILEWDWMGSWVTTKRGKHSTDKNTLIYIELIN